MPPSVAVSPAVPPTPSGIPESWDETSESTLAARPWRRAAAVVPPIPYEAWSDTAFDTGGEPFDLDRMPLTPPAAPGTFAPPFRSRRRRLGRRRLITAVAAAGALALVAAVVSGGPSTVGRSVRQYVAALTGSPLLARLREMQLADVSTWLADWTAARLQAVPSVDPGTDGPVATVPAPPGVAESTGTSASAEAATTTPSQPTSRLGAVPTPRADGETMRATSGIGDTYEPPGRNSRALAAATPAPARSPGAVPPPRDPSALSTSAASSAVTASPLPEPWPPSVATPQPTPSSASNVPSTSDAARPPAPPATPDLVPAPALVSPTAAGAPAPAPARSATPPPADASSPSTARPPPPASTTSTRPALPPPSKVTLTPAEIAARTTAPAGAPAPPTAAPPAASRPEAVRADAAPPEAARPEPVRAETATRPAASPPAPASAAPAAPSAAATGEDPERVRADQNITSTLTRYRNAYASLNAGAARQVFPSVDERALTRAFSGLRSQNLRFDVCQTRLVSADQARVVCKGSATFITRVGSREPRTVKREWEFSMQRRGDEWMIASATTR